MAGIHRRRTLASHLQAYLSSPGYFALMLSFYGFLRLTLSPLTTFSQLRVDFRCSYRLG
jgi:hypothetical protein